MFNIFKGIAFPEFCSRNYRNQVFHDVYETDGRHPIDECFLTSPEELALGRESSVIERFSAVDVLYLAFFF